MAIRQLLALALVASVASLISADPFVVVNDPGNFTISTVTMTTANNNHWKAYELATVTIEGMTQKRILAGTVKYQLYEAFVPSFIGQGNSAYFTCNNKGCDPTMPVALTLTYPTAEKSKYKLEFSFTMAKAQKGGDFRVVIYGQDQDHFPYDFSSTISFNYTATSA